MNWNNFILFIAGGPRDSTAGVSELGTWFFISLFIGLAFLVFIAIMIPETKNKYRKK
jgi:hypothetical protein